MGILVTGGVGFIGSHYVDLLVERGELVYVVDKMTYAATAKNVNEKASAFERWDIGNEIVSDFLSYHKIKQVVNFAAETHVDRSIMDPEAFLRTDVLGLFHLVRSCRRAGVEKFIHVSTDEVYGPMVAVDGFHPQPEAREDAPLRPTSPYSASKAAADLLLLSYYRTYGFPAIIVRPCNQYGPRQYPEKLVPSAVTRSLKGLPVLVHGRGFEIREWMWVGDCCQMIDAVRQGGKVGEIYNVGSGYRLKNSELLGGLSLSLAAHGVEMRLKFVPNRPGNDARYALDSSKLHRAFGKKYTPFEVGLERTVAWYKGNPDWWEGAVDWNPDVYEGNRDYLR